MKLAALVLCLGSATGMFGQRKHFSWQDACFKNPTAPYCQGHDMAIKHGRGNAQRGQPESVGPGGTVSTSENAIAPSVIVAGSINWRFADPAADALVGFNVTKVWEASLGRRLIAEIAAEQGLDEPDILKVFDRLANVNQVALSIHQNRVAIMISGGVADLPLPAVDAGWKAVRVGASSILIGHTDAVDQAADRIAFADPLAELPRLAQQRHSSGDFWVFGTPASAGAEATYAGVKRFWVTASVAAGFTCEGIFEFDAVPESATLAKWPALARAVIEDKTARANWFLNGDDVEPGIPQIVKHPLAQRIGPFLKASLRLPPRDAKTEHTKPVIYGLEGGPKEVKQ